MKYLIIMLALAATSFSGSAQAATDTTCTLENARFIQAKGRSVTVDGVPMNPNQFKTELAKCNYVKSLDLYNRWRLERTMAWTFGAGGLVLWPLLPGAVVAIPLSVNLRNKMVESTLAHQ